MYWKVVFYNFLFLINEAFKKINSSKHIPYIKCSQRELKIYKEMFGIELIMVVVPVCIHVNMWVCACMFINKCMYVCKYVYVTVVCVCLCVCACSHNVTWLFLTELWRVDTYFLTTCLSVAASNSILQLLLASVTLHSKPTSP